MHKRIKINLIFCLIIAGNLCDAEYVLEDFKLQPFLPTSMALSFMVKIFNDGKPPTDSKIPALRMEMISCCQIVPGQNEISDCNSMKLRSGLFHRIKPGERKSLLTFFPNKHLINRIGFCTFRIHGERSIKPFRIDFNTAEGYPHIPHSDLASNNGPKPCKYIDQDPVRSCKPVNCIEKYTGYRSFYNEKTGMCEPTPFCLDTKKLNSDDTLLHKEEHQPGLMLNPDTNKCVNETIYKSLKARAIVLLDEDERNMSTKTFAALYGITLAKLTVALMLTLIFMIVICIVLKFCFCCLPCCVVFKDEKMKKYSHKGSAKYVPIINEAEAAPDSATKIITEIRDRREMTKKKDWKSDDKKDNGPHSNKSNDESPKDGGSSPTMDAAQDLKNLSRSVSDRGSFSPTTATPKNTTAMENSTHTIHPPQKSSSNASVITFRKLPNVARLLHQVDNTGEKKSNYNSRQALSQDLERAFGRDMRFPKDNSNKFSYNESVSMPQEIPDPSSHILNLKDVPPLKPIIHQIQEPSRGSQYFPKQGHESGQVPKIRTRVSGFQQRHDSQGSRQLEQRFYKDEMAKVASFLRELEQRRSVTSPIYFEKRPLEPEQFSQSSLSNVPDAPRKSTVNDTAVGTNGINKVTTKPLGSVLSTSSEKPIRRIKDEAPIPLSMICSETTLNRMKTTEAQENKTTYDDTSQRDENNSNNLSWEQQPDEIFETFHSPICSSTPKEAPLSPPCQSNSFHDKISSAYNTPSNPFESYEGIVNNKANFNENGRKTPSVQSFQSLSELCRNTSQTEIPLQFQIPPDFKSKLAPFVDVTSFTVPIPIKNKERPPCVKFQTPSSSTSKPHDPGFRHDDDFLRRTANSSKDETAKNVWYCTGRSKPTEEKFRVVKETNSQNLIHSPPQLSESETSMEGSECLENRIDPRTSCFFDDYLQPLRRPSVSDEILSQNRWIDNFKSE